MAELADIGVLGLAVMGANLARNAARKGFGVAVYNRHPDRTDVLVKEHGKEGTFFPAKELKAFVASIRPPRPIIIMVKAGAPVDQVIDELLPYLDKGDIVIDGGNSEYTDTNRRAATLKAKGFRFVGMGVSGGEEGALLGPSMMPGGEREAYARIEPIVKKMAAEVEDTPCVAYIGPEGAGHYVKMVHNGIEYADMQLIAEAYDLLKSVYGLSADEIAEHLRGMEEGRPRFLPDRDHRRGAPQERCDRRRAGRLNCRRGGAEGDRALGRALRARSRRAAHDDHRSGLRTRALSAAGTADRSGEDHRTCADADTQGDARRHRRDSRRALCVEDCRLRAGLRGDGRGVGRVRLGPEARRACDDLARRLHHPRTAPPSHPRSLCRRRSRSEPSAPPVLPRRREKGGAELAQDGGDSPSRAACRRRPFQPRSPITTVCAARAGRRTCCRAFATILARTRTPVSTSPENSIPAGRRTAAKSPSLRGRSERPAARSVQRDELRSHQRVGQHRRKDRHVGHQDQEQEEDRDEG